MPYRLRVAFDPQQFLTLQADKGLFARTGVAAGFTYVPNAVIADTWTKLSSSAYTYGDSRAGPNINQGWTNPGISTITGKIFLAQAQPTQANFGNFLFDPSLGYWTRTNAVTGDWHRCLLGYNENYQMTFDPDRNVFMRSNGGPIAGGGGDYNGSPHLGDAEYSVDTDEWSTPWPDADSTYVPLPADTGYWGHGIGTTYSMQGFDSCYVWFDGYVYQWGNTSVSSQSFKRRDMTTGIIAVLAGGASCPPSTGETRSGMYLRGGVNSGNRQLYWFANEMAYWVWDLTLTTPAWTAVTTTGTRPQTVPSNSYPTNTSTDWGILACIDEAANCAVAWCGKNVIASDTGIDYRKTWLMDLATREWRDGPSLAGGHTVPPATTAVNQRLMYDKVNRRTVLTVGLNNITQVWALQIAPIGGKITSWALPARSGSTYGTNYYGFPFTSNGGSKHVAMAYCPLDGRLYASGGDSIHSAVDGIWSMSLEDGTWRMDVGEPVYSTIPAPHSMQDGALFEWMPSRNKFIFGFGGYFPYDAAGADVLNYSKGWWTYDPLTATWEQQLSFFNVESPPNGGTGGGTGNEYGGVYDPDTDTVYVLADGTTTPAARRYNIGTGVQDASITYTIPSSGVSGYTGVYFMRTRQCRIDRYIYAIGYYTNGVSSAPANNIAALWRYGIDDHTFTRLAAPPVFTQNVSDLELVLCSSNGKLVHPRRYGPDGAMAEGIHIYNPANNSWTTDTKTPAYGAWIQNSVCALPDGRVAMSGGAFGSQQTHVWFYEAT